MIELEGKINEKVRNYLKRTDVIMFGEESTKNYLPIFSDENSIFIIDKENKKIRIKI